jgi:hypothetical protein
MLKSGAEAALFPEKEYIYGTLVAEYSVSVCVPEEWPPGELEDGLAEEGAHPDHEEDVEDGRAHDSPDPHICVEKIASKSIQMSFIKRSFHQISSRAQRMPFLLQR